MLAWQTLATPSHRLRRARLFIDVQHGLCNRLRALSSAAALAEAADRELVVVWVPDHHCEARIGDLLHFDGTVIESSQEALLLRERATRVYNYMEIEPGARFREPVLDPSEAVQGDVFVRSAYTLTSRLIDSRADQRFLRGLRPVEPVVDLVRRGLPRADLALHVRMATGPAFDHLSYESPANWPKERHEELVRWRRHSDVARFISRIDALLKERQIETMFVAADLAKTYEVLIDRYGPKVHMLRRDLFDRSVQQIQYALADLILLASARYLLASTWSSFSDLAQRLAPEGRPVERSGTDF